MRARSISESEREENKMERIERRGCKCLYNYKSPSRCAECVRERGVGEIYERDTGAQRYTSRYIYMYLYI